MSDTASSRIAVAGSERTLPPGTTPAPAEPTALVEVTVVLRPRNTTAPPAGTFLTRENFAAVRGADPGDALAVERFAIEHDLLVLEADLSRRAVTLQGTVTAMNSAFGVSLQQIESGGATIRVRGGSITLPAALAPRVTGVFGLDERPVATPKFRRRGAVAHAAAGVSYTPLQLAKAYAFPTGVDGTGETIAIIELGGGFVQADLDTYFRSLGLSTPNVTAVAVGTGTNAPTGDPSGPDTEVMLDIEVAGAVAPGADIAVYFADNTDAGFLAAITTAIHDTANKPSIVSISWGGPESSWTQQALQNFDAAFADAGTLGISVFCAAGDGGSTDGLTDGLQHADFPASSPNVVGCGGTALKLSGTTIASEKVWNDGTGGGATGGGISDVFAVPAYQKGVGVPPSANPGGHVGRGVPDVAADADPATGYQIYADGKAGVVGGTSAVAPLYAGLFALLLQKLGRPLGLPNVALYAHAAAFRDITAGTNGAYHAAPAWDPCTGLGSPDGEALLAALQAPAAVPPAPPAL